MINDSIIIWGREYSKGALLEAIPSFALDNDFGFQLYQFLLKWFDNNSYIVVSTSGSTGVPKKMQVEKKKMINSALTTCEYLELQHNMKALLCLPISGIGGMMMVVRAIVCKLDLLFVEPSGYPLKNILCKIDFMAMVPLQVHNLLSEKDGINKIQTIKKIIIGGSSISDHLEDSLRECKNEIYLTYGMTETLSHIALRKLNSCDSSKFYTPLKNVSISLDKRNCLVIDAPNVNDDIVKTNDIAEINADGNFHIIGRYDNVINTGGIKIQVEELESKIQKLFDFDIAITSKPDDKFGNVIVLLSEKQITKIDFAKYLKKHEIPKLIIDNIIIPKTHTGKIDRLKCKKLVDNVDK